MKEKPQILDRRHNDWPFPFSLIPRRWTAFNWGKPVMVRGNQRDIRNFAPAPVGEADSFQVSRYPDAPKWAKPFAWYFAWSGKVKPDGWYRHWRIGGRYDDIDDYVQFPSLATRRFPAMGERDTTA